ncbi:MAG: AbrB/MazE/SpoVT family DNA-binding domain-containing protein [Candidatus Aenigmarchaeota archaeon]|nr:AbrB/MazE/SpoVT family DNA-binding domain-containing protein [Candidatus Aenigmarchaeota archaeon]
MKEKICAVCQEGRLEEADNIASEIEGYIFVEKGWRCSKCGEEFIKENEAQRTIEIARKLGIWPKPLKLHRSISKSGRGLVLRIPSDLEDDLNLKPGQRVSISRVGHKIIVETEGK